MVESQVDEHEEGLNEYIPRQFAPATGHWLYYCCNALSKRKKPPPEDDREYDKLFGK
jgi:hypothetical protein